MRYRFFGPVVLFGFSIIVLILPQKIRALGLSPSSIEVQGVLSGSTVTKEFYIVRGHPDQDEVGKVMFHGPIAQYVHLGKGLPLRLPKGERISAVTIRIQPNLPTGSYEVPFTISTETAPALSSTKGSSQGLTTTGSGVQIGINGTLRFSVTNETIEQYVIQAIDMNESEEDLPWGFSYKFINTGNVDARPTKIELTITDIRDPTNIYVETIGAERLEFVPAFSDKVINVLTNAHFKIGAYAVEAKFYQSSGAIVYEQQRPTTVQIWPRGTLAQKGDLEEFTTEKEHYEFGEPVKLSGRFRNIGEIALTGSWVVDIFRKNVRVEVLKNETGFIPKGAEVNFETFYQPTEAGPYRVVMYVRFGPFKTPERSVTFRVGGISPWSLGLTMGLGAVILGGLIWLLHLRKKKLTKKVTNP